MADPPNRAAGVDLVVTVYDRTLREVLAPGALTEIAAGSAYSFARRTLLVNNVASRAEAEALARERIAAGELDHVDFVADHLDRALRLTGLTRAEIEPIAYFTDWAIVAATMPGPEWVLHWDAEVRMIVPVDWITPALELMRRDRRVMVANPYWNVPTLEQTTWERDGEFALGHGFSDQVWLARRAELSRPIYHQRSLARLRYPMAHVGHIFEARVDAHLRHHGRLRATHVRATYRHPPNMGISYPPRTRAQTLRYVRNRLVTGGLLIAPVKPRSLRHM
ncbi:MAG: hypothetical protein QOE11_3718 [Solirubrobacteraceae bacterium]|jgi:hypothetical protein|nr:hypothetical protein [Solirubrobacteraceae bacterium]